MSKKHTSTFVLQRASAVVLIPLAIWFLISLVAHAGDSFVDMRVWLSKPTTSLPFAALIVIGAYHGRIGLEEVIVDYIQSWLKTVLIFLSWLVAAALMGVAVWSAYQLSFAG